MTIQSPPPLNGKFRTRLGLILTFVGFLIFLIGAVPGIFGLDRSPVIGFVQIGVFLAGLALICVGGYVCINGLWSNQPKTIIADIGIRLVSTGYVIAFVCGFADVFGFGTQIPPTIPYYGSLQATGVLVGETIIAVGFILQIPYHLFMKTPPKRVDTIQTDQRRHNDLNIAID